MATVLLVDDHEVGRVGRHAMLAELGHQVHSCRWAQLAPHGTPDWIRPDVTVAVVRADPSRWDRYGALNAMPRLAEDGFGPPGAARRRADSLGRMVAVVNGGGATNPMLGIRLAHRGIDEVVVRHQVDCARGLAELVAGRLPTAPSEPDPDLIAERGIGRRSDPDRVIERVLELARDNPAYAAAFEPGNRQLDSGLSRRRAHTLRVRVTDLGDLLPRTGRGQGGPVRDWSLPSWIDIVAFVNLCRGAEAEAEDDASGTHADFSRA